MNNPQWELVSCETSSSETDTVRLVEPDLGAAADELGQRLGDVTQFRAPDDPDPAIALFGRIDAFAETVRPAPPEDLIHPRSHEIDDDRDDHGGLGGDVSHAAADLTEIAVDDTVDLVLDPCPVDSIELIDTAATSPTLAHSTAPGSTKDRPVTDGLLDRLRRHRTLALVVATFTFAAAVLASGLAGDSIPSLFAGDDPTPRATNDGGEAAAPAGPEIELTTATTPDTLVVRRQAISDGEAARTAGPDGASADDAHPWPGPGHRRDRHGPGDRDR